MGARGSGLSAAGAEARLAADGPNALPRAEPIPAWRRFFGQFAGALVRILLVALAIDLGLWAWEGAATVPIESIAIGAILLVNAVLGAYQEFRSEQALAQLEAMSAPLAWVVREGALVHVATRTLVRGDVVRVESGERVPADGVLLEAEGLAVDESILTGESLSIDRTVGDEVQSGTLAVRGRGYFEVRRTGPRSTMGKIAALIGTVPPVPTPLERRLDVLGNQIGLVVGGLAVGLLVAGVAAEGLERFSEILIFAVALAVAAVPEGMAAVVTLTLALGVQRMATRRAVVRRLAAVESLGSVTVIATDKTGTLTENQMRVHALEAVDRARALRAMVFANDADTSAEAGDPLELGLYAFARSEGLDPAALRARHPRTSGRPFDSAWKYMRATLDDEGPRSYLKGAPEALLARCELTPEERTRWSERAEVAASAGHRVLALATGGGETEERLELLGLVLLWDPPRAEVPDAIAAAQSAGIRVVMITGDHPGTAAAIARAIGMRDVRARTGAELDGLDDAGWKSAVREASVFARVTPDHKLRLVEALRATGNVVAMTGDGVNDAPALKRADVGVAMGKRGSDVAREVADLVLLDDNFATIVGAIEEGRSIYQNIQSFIRFTFSTNVALVLLVVIGAVGAYVEGLRRPTGELLLPLTALQLLWINFLGDGPPALALAVDRAPDVMARPPRDANAWILDGPSLRFVGMAGLAKGTLGLAVLLVGPMAGLSHAATQALVFHYHAVAKLMTSLPARRVASRPLPNVVLLGSLVLGIGLQSLVFFVPPVAEALEVAPIDVPTTFVFFGCVLVSWLAAELAARLVSARVSRTSRG
ncbi:MAG: cation-transporting P-type ATPase [Sandaracinus sp.]